MTQLLSPKLRVGVNLGPASGPPGRLVRHGFVNHQAARIDEQGRAVSLGPLMSNRRGVD